MKNGNHLEGFEHDVRLENPVPPVHIYFPEEDIAQIQDEIGDILRTGMLVLGSRTRLFEKEFSEYLGVRNSVAVSSGTAALEIALRSLGVEGKDVVVPSNTFYATAGAVVHAGGNVRFADVDPSTFCLDVEVAESMVDENTAGIILVHVGGIISPEIQKLREFCDSKGIFLLEDSAHAHGSTLNGRKAGTFGHVGTFSFFPTKVMTSGEGGMIVTNSDDIANEARIYRDQGKNSNSANYHTHLGYAWRMSELHALVGLTQLRRLDEFIARRRSIAQYYNEALQSVHGVVPLDIPAEVESNYYKYLAVLSDPSINRDTLKGLLSRDYGVKLSGGVYDIPLHKQPVFSKESKTANCPNTELVCNSHICLPVSALMQQSDAVYVVDALRHAINRIRS